MCQMVFVSLSMVDLYKLLIFYLFFWYLFIYTRILTVHYKFTNFATGPKYKKFKEKIYTKIVAIHISLHDNIKLIN